MPDLNGFASTELVRVTLSNDFVLYGYFKTPHQSKDKVLTGLWVFEANEDSAKLGEHIYLLNPSAIVSVQYAV